MFWISCLILLALACLFVLYPLWSHYRSSDEGPEQIRTDVNLSIFEERQRELEADLDSGNLDQEQFKALLLELKKTLLIDTGSDSKPKAKPSKADSKGASKVKNNNLITRAVPLGMLLLVPFAAYYMYGQWGYINDVELMDLYERTVSNVDDQQETRNLVISLGRVVQEDPENEWAWYFLARNFSNMGQFPEAEIAFQQSSERMPEGPDKAAVLGQYAQIKYVTSGGELTEEVRAIVDQAMAINPSEFASLQLLALVAENNDDYQAAIGYWRLMIQANPNSAQAQVLRNSIAAAQQILAEQGGQSGAVASGPRIEVSVMLADGLELPEDLRVFVAARNAEREGMPPLAAIDLLVSDLPATIILDDNLAVGPFNLSSASSVFITATVSLSGTANVQSGDYRQVSQSFAHKDEQGIVDLVISDRVP